MRVITHVMMRFMTRIMTCVMTRITELGVFKIIHVTQLHKILDHADETQCGRPISIRRFDQKRLIVADAYRGIYLLDVEIGICCMKML